MLEFYKDHLPPTIPLLIPTSKIQILRAAALLPTKPGSVYSLQVPNLRFCCENLRSCLNRDLRKASSEPHTPAISLPDPQKTHKVFPAGLS